MAAYSELELKYAEPVARGLLNSADFRKWFLLGTRFEDLNDPRPLGEIQGKGRSRTLKNPFWFNYWCGLDSRCTCRIGTGIETDILIMLDCDNDRRLAIHVEVKRPGDHLRIGQAESYPRRAACWANPDTRPKSVYPHSDFLTALVCGRELGSDTRVGFFDKVLFHDEIAAQIGPYLAPYPWLKMHSAT